MALALSALAGTALRRTTLAAMVLAAAVLTLTRFTGPRLGVTGFPMARFGMTAALGSATAAPISAAARFAGTLAWARGLRPARSAAMTDREAFAGRRT